MVASYYTDVENFIFNSLTTIKRDVFGDKNMKESLLFIDDLNMNVQKDKYDSSTLFEFLIELFENKYIYDTKNNANEIFKKIQYMYM